MPTGNVSTLTTFHRNWFTALFPARISSSFNKARDEEATLNQQKKRSLDIASQTCHLASTET
ncbi:hypothetical protein CCR75_009623 [Bremia lactucae]|uniref:Uncharacterized protein n=1 Tax=Bremia lactucae TaxID=4779 RepID=A0A976ICB7_BRELC|nr:hypothetical protein CCR75_009623 [Bremia lactucae]